MNMRIAIAALASMLAGALSANAADIARPVYKAQPPVASAYNWSGFYVGGNLGYGWGKNTGALWDAVNDPGPLLVGFEPYFAAGGNQLPGTKPFGILGGGQIGFNWQVSSIVFGVVADLQAAALKDTQSVSPVIPPNANITQTNQSNVDWFGTVRGRVGFAANNWLFYGTGGLAYGKAESTLTFNCFGCGPPTVWAGSGSSTKTGWAAGAGIEVGLTPNWTVGVEYLRVDLGSIATVASFSSGAAGVGASTVSADSKYVVDIVRGTLNYKFDWGKAPVVAKY